MTDVEAAAVLRLIVVDHWVTSEQGVAAIKRAIELLEKSAAEAEYWAAMQAAHPIPWPGTAAESNAAIRESIDWGEAAAIADENAYQWDGPS